MGNGLYGGWILRNGRLGLLTALVPAPWEIESVAGINDAGVIIGQGYNPATGTRGAVVLTPP